MLINCFDLKSTARHTLFIVTSKKFNLSNNFNADVKKEYLHLITRHFHHLDLMSTQIGHYYP